MNELRFGPIIFLGNEFFDALPIKQFYINKKIALERHVSLSKKNQKLQFSYKKVKKKIIQNMRKLDLISQDNIVEYPLDSIKYLELISKNINNHGGGLLCFDYGYIAKKNKDTLQSIKKHKYQNILLNPGNADITSHINYNLFTKILKKNNLKVEKITNQSKFFYKLGIVERANMVSKKMNFKTKADLFYRLKKLLHHNEMGGLFKVLFAHKNDTKFSLGF